MACRRPGYWREYRRKQREAMRAAGLCYDCGEPSEAFRCPPCKEIVLIKLRARRVVNEAAA